MKRLVLLFLFLPAAYFASGQVPGTPYGVRGLACSVAPATPEAITLSATTVNLNGTFTASVPEVTTGTQIPTSYSWTIPAGLTPTGPLTTSEPRIELTGATAGTYNIKVKANNACGSSAEKVSASTVIVRSCTAAPTLSGNQDYAVNKNATENITVTADGNGDAMTMTYRWQSSTTGSSDWTDVASNGTSASYTVPTSTAGTIYYHCLVTNSCGTSTSGNYAITVHDCTAAPASPTLTITATTINLNGTVTLSCANVGNGATTYAWSLPDGLTGSTTSTTNSITVTGETAGTYAANTISVTATNACGNTTATGTGGAITVCSTPPAQPGAITIPAVVAVNTNFTAQISAVSGATGYTWNIPAGLTIVSGQNTTTVTYKASSAGTIATGAITVTANNACGNSDARTSASAITVPNCPGYFAAGGEYATSVSGYLAISSGTTFAELIDSNGSWKFAKTGKDLCYYKNDGNSGSTADWSTAKSGCEGTSTSYNDGTPGWRLPNIAELGAIQSIHSSLASQSTSADGTTNLRTGLYWSSTEGSDGFAVNWTFDVSYTYWRNKTYSNYVRCVRRN